MPRGEPGRRWISRDPIRPGVGVAAARVIDRRGFLIWGLVVLVASSLSGAQLARDAFFLRPGEHDTLTAWHGLPWPLLVWLMAALSPLWLLVLFAAWHRHRGPLRRSVAVVAWLVGLVYPVLWGLFLLPSRRG